MQASRRNVHVATMSTMEQADLRRAVHHTHRLAVEATTRGRPAHHLHRTDTLAACAAYMVTLAHIGTGWLRIGA